MVSCDPGLWWYMYTSSQSHPPMFFNIENQGRPGRSSDRYTGTLASSPGHSHIFNVARREFAMLKTWEWPGDEATGTLLHIDISVH